MSDEKIIPFPLPEPRNNSYTESISEIKEKSGRNAYCVYNNGNLFPGIISFDIDTAWLELILLTGVPKNILEEVGFCVNMVYVKEV